MERPVYDCLEEAMKHIEATNFDASYFDVLMAMTWAILGLWGEVRTVANLLASKEGQWLPG